MADSIFFPADIAPDSDLAAKHKSLRSYLTWLLPTGALLLGWLAYLLFSAPNRTTLDGYRFRQVGVQPDSTVWILAYRTDNGQAEVLFSRDTAAGWQRHTLGVDSSEARALALNWGGKALLLGDTTVRVFNDSLKQVGPIVYPFERGQGIEGRWLALDTDGGRAVVAGQQGEVYAITKRGSPWKHVLLTEGGKSALQAVNYAGTEPGTLLSVRFGLISRRGFIYLTMYDVTGTISSSYTIWHSYLPAPVAWCGHGAGDPLVAYDRQGNWTTATGSGQDAEAGRFFGSVRSAVRIGQTNHFLGVSATRLFWADIRLPQPLPASVATTAAVAAPAAASPGAPNRTSTKQGRQSAFPPAAGQLSRNQGNPPPSRGRAGTPPNRNKLPAGGNELTRDKPPVERPQGARNQSVIPPEDQNAPGPTGTGDNMSNRPDYGKGSTPGQGGSREPEQPKMTSEQLRLYLEQRKQQLQQSQPRSDVLPGKPSPGLGPSKSLPTQQQQIKR